jgi:hypothetical protein
MKKQFYKKLSTLVTLLLTSYLSFAQTIVVDGINYNITSLSTVEVGSNSFITGEVVIPSSVTDGGTTYSVTNIGASAFQYSYDLTKLTIPNTVTSIGEFAFSHSNLTSITIPNSVTIIGNHSFQSCTSLSSIRIPNSVTTIGMGAFFMLTSLTSINIPSSVTNFGLYAFYGNNALDSVMVESQVPQIITTDVFVNNSPKSTLYVPKGTVSTYQSATGWGSFPYIVEQCIKTDSTLTITACDNYFFNGVDRTVSDTYTQTLTNAAGCDSIVTLNLTINKKPVFSIQPQEVNICVNDTMYLNFEASNTTIYKHYLSEFGTSFDMDLSEGTNAIKIKVESQDFNGAYFVASATNECGVDTSDFVLLNFNAVDTTVSVDNDYFMANEIEVSYQWINADTKTIIENATNRSFTPTQSGNYAVIVTGICSDTSGAHHYDLIITNSDAFNSTNVNIYPNPATDNIRVTLTDAVSGTISIVDLHGNTVASKTIGSSTTNISTADLASGVYVVKFSSAKGVAVKQLIIE